MAHSPGRSRSRSRSRSPSGHGDANASPFAQTVSELGLDGDSDGDDTHEEDEQDDDDGDYDLRGGAGGPAPETYAMLDVVAGRGVSVSARREEADDDDDDDDVEGAASRSLERSELYTPEEDARVRRKFDRNLVLFVAMLFMLSFVDRSNIGNARIAGMDDDLQTSPPRDDWYEWSLTAFYASYISFEWLALLFRLVPAH
ncbi:hypothetical protein E4U41_002092, partial [Claviceps citrina]